MERKSAWLKYADTDVAKVMAFGEDYRKFISSFKIEREIAAETIRMAE